MDVVSPWSWVWTDWAEFQVWSLDQVWSHPLVWVCLILAPVCQPYLAARDREKERGFRNTQEIWLTTDKCTRHQSIHPPGLSDRMQKMWKMFDPYHCHLFGLEGGGARWWCSGSWTTGVFLKKACFIQAILSRWGERCATRRGWILAKGKESHVISIYVSLPLQTTTISWTINNQNKNQTILTSFETSTTKLSSLFSPSLSCKDRP